MGTKQQLRKASNVSLPADIYDAVMEQKHAQGRTTSSIHESALRLYISWQQNDPDARAFIPPSLEVDRVVLRRVQSKNGGAS